MSDKKHVDAVEAARQLSLALLEAVERVGLPVDDGIKGKARSLISALKTANDTAAGAQCDHEVLLRADLGEAKRLLDTLEDAGEVSEDLKHRAKALAASILAAAAWLGSR